MVAPVTINEKIYVACDDIINGRVGNTLSQVFAASGTFTVPESVSSVLVTVLGAGGGGGGGNPTGGAGGGGGAGAFVSRFPLSVAPGASLTVTVGAGGAGAAINATGVAGGVTTVTGGLTACPAGFPGLGGSVGAAANGGSTP